MGPEENMNVLAEVYAREVMKLNSAFIRVSRSLSVDMVSDIFELQGKPMLEEPESMKYPHKKITEEKEPERPVFNRYRALIDNE